MASNNRLITLLLFSFLSPLCAIAPLVLSDYPQLPDTELVAVCYAIALIPAALAGLLFVFVAPFFWCGFVQRTRWGALVSGLSCSVLGTLMFLLGLTLYY